MNGLDANVVLVPFLRGDGVSRFLHTLAFGEHAVRRCTVDCHLR